MQYRTIIMSLLPIRPTTRRLLTAAGVVVASCAISSPALAAANAPAANAPAAQSRPAVATCTGAADLGFRIAKGPSSGTAGVTDYTLVFTNTSKSTCSLSGFPYISMISKKGSQLGSAASQPRMLVIPLVTLAPGASAHSTLAYSSGKVSSASGCGPVTTAYELRAFVADQKRALYARTGLHACSRAGHVYLSVLQSFRAGS
jgi:hypothetical protein